MDVNKQMLKQDVTRKKNHLFTNNIIDLNIILYYIKCRMEMQGWEEIPDLINPVQRAYE